MHVLVRFGARNTRLTAAGEKCMISFIHAGKTHIYAGGRKPLIWLRPPPSAPLNNGVQFLGGQLYSDVVAVCSFMPPYSVRALRARSTKIICATSCAKCSLPPTSGTTVE
jgi:hypothetical protein